MRIAVISGSFRPGFSYQENIWSEQLAVRGHDVRIFAPRHGAERSPVYGERAPAPVKLHPVPIERIPTLALASRHLYRTRNLAPAVRRFAPALILWFGPPQGFGVDVAADPQLAAVPLIAFLGENRAMQPFDRARTPRDRIRALAYRLARRPAIVLACRRAKRVIANTPETPAIIRAMLPPALRETAPISALPLGFDPASFGPDPTRRRPADGAIVAVVSSRFAPEKLPSLRLILAALDAAMNRAPTLRAVLVGFDGGPTSRAIEAQIDASTHAARFERRPFADRQGLARAFHQADLAIFARPSISAQEALGTGLYAVLADGAMGGLLDEDDDGCFFAPGDPAALSAALISATARLAHEPPTARDARAARAARLGYDRIIDAVLADLGLSPYSGESPSNAANSSRSIKNNT